MPPLFWYETASSAATGGWLTGSAEAGAVVSSTNAAATGATRERTEASSARPEPRQPGTVPSVPHVAQATHRASAAPNTSGPAHPWTCGAAALSQPDARPKGLEPLTF